MWSLLWPGDFTKISEQFLYLCFEVAGDLFVDNKRDQISNQKTKILHQQSTFTVFPPKEPPPAWVR